MRNTGLDEAQVGIKIAGRNISNFRYANDPTLTAESEEELKSLLMKVKEREKGAPHPGRVCPSLWLPGPLRQGKAQNPGATDSALLWRTRKPEPHSTPGPLHIEQQGA